MNDAAFDREIESLLGVEPSPEFVARVRTRVAQEPEPSRWRLSWAFATAAAVAAAVVIVAVAVWPSRETSLSLAEPAPSPRVAEVVQALTPPGLPAEAPRPPKPRAIAATPVRNTDVEVAAEDARAFDVLLVTLRERDVVLVFDESGESALSAAALAIAPIAIDPVQMIAEAEGGVE